MLIEACLVTVIAVSCLNDQGNRDQCPIKRDRAEVVVKEFEKRNNITLLAGDSPENQRHIFRGVWGNHKNDKVVVQYNTETDVCTQQTPAEFIEQQKREQSQKRWL